MKNINEETPARAKIIDRITENLGYLEPLRGVNDMIVANDVIETMSICRNDAVILFEDLNSAPDKLKVISLFDRSKYKADQLYKLMNDELGKNTTVKGHFYQIRDYPICKELIRDLYNTDFITVVEKLAQMDDWDEVNNSLLNYYRNVSNALLDRDFLDESPINLMDTYTIPYLRNSDITDIYIDDMKTWLDTAMSSPVMELYSYAEEIYKNTISIIDGEYEFDRRRIEHIASTFDGSSFKAYSDANNEILNIAEGFVKSIYIKSEMIFYIYAVIIKYCIDRTNLNMALINDINTSLIQYFTSIKK